jgi:hypothetical protein
MAEAAGVELLERTESTQLIASKGSPNSQKWRKQRFFGAILAQPWGARLEAWERLFLPA